MGELRDFGNSKLPTQKRLHTVMWHMHIDKYIRFSMEVSVLRSAQSFLSIPYHRQYAKAAHHWCIVHSGHIVSPEIIESSSGVARFQYTIQPPSHLGWIIASWRSGHAGRMADKPVLTGTPPNLKRIRGTPTFQTVKHKQARYHLGKSCSLVWYN